MRLLSALCSDKEPRHLLALAEGLCVENSMLLFGESILRVHNTVSYLFRDIWFVQE
jgi:hypothetical protein